TSAWIPVRTRKVPRVRRVWLMFDGSATTWRHRRCDAHAGLLAGSSDEAETPLGHADQGLDAPPELDAIGLDSIPENYAAIVHLGHDHKFVVRPKKTFGHRNAKGWRRPRLADE